MTTIAERMKKYAELVGNKVFLNYCDDMFADLQSTMNALEVARESIYALIDSMRERIDSGSTFAGKKEDGIYFYPCSPTVTIQLEDALKTINQILGEKK